MSKRTLLFSLILFLALVVSLWLIHRSLSQPAQKPVDVKKTPDAFMKDAVYMSFDEEGNLHNKISTKKMVHYAYDNMSNFIKPDIIFFASNRAPWYVSADNGQSKDGIDVVNLSNNVKIYEPASKTNHELTITTSNLIIFPKLKTVKTSEPITIIQPGTIVNAVGLNADLKKGEVVLLSHAQGIFETSNSSTNNELR